MWQWRTFYFCHSLIKVQKTKCVILTASSEMDNFTDCVSGDKAAQIGSAASEPSGEAGHCWTRVQRSAISCHAWNGCLQGLLWCFFCSIWLCSKAIVNYGNVIHFKRFLIHMWRFCNWFLIFQCLTYHQFLNFVIANLISLMGKVQADFTLSLVFRIVTLQQYQM